MQSPAEAKGADGMRMRLSALMRKAGVAEADPDAAGMLDLLLRKMHTKRDYEDVLGSPEAAERMARASGMNTTQLGMLLELQNQKDVFTPNPLLDLVLTAMFVAQIALVGWAMVDRGLMWLFVLLLVIIDSIIRRCVWCWASRGGRLRRTTAAAAVTAAAASSRLQRGQAFSMTPQLPSSGAIRAHPHPCS